MKGLKKKNDSILAMLIELNSDQEVKVPGTRTPTLALYRMAPSEMAKFKKQSDELLDAKFIQSSKAPSCALIHFQKNKDGSIRMCVDCRALNKVKIKKQVFGPQHCGFV